LKACQFQPELGAAEQQVAVDVVFRDAVDGSPRRQVARGARPRLARVGRFQDVRCEVAVLVVVEAGVHRAGVVLGGNQLAHVRPVRDAGEQLDLAPVLAAVLGDLNQPVVGADVDQPALEGRFGQRHAVAVQAGRAALEDGVRPPHLAHHRERVAVDLAGQVAADRRPRVAAVVAPVEPVRREVQPLRVVRAEHQRAVPVPPRRRLALAGHRLNLHPLAGLAVVPADHAVLQHPVYGVRVGRIDLAVEPVAALDHEPVLVHDPVLRPRPRRAAEREVVLRTAVDVVERPALVARHVVKLGDGQVRFVSPVRGPVEALVDPAVAPDEVVLGILRVDPDLVIVDVLPLLAQRAERPPAVVGHPDEDVHHVQPVLVGGIDDQVRVVLRLGVERVALLPGDAPVGTAEDAPLRRLDDGVDHVRVGRRHRQPDPPDISAGQPAADLLPGLAAVGGTVDCASRSAVDDGPHVPAALPARGDQHVRIARVEHQVRHTGVFVDRQHPRPRLAAVGRLVQPAVAPFFPERPLGGHVNRVRVARVDDDLADVLARLQSDVRPRLAAVGALVHAVAVGHAPLAVVLPRPDPHHVRVLGVEYHAPDRERAFAVEDGRERGAAVGRLPHPAARHRDVVLRAVGGVDGEPDDAAGGDRRADQPRLERAERQRTLIFFLRFGFDRLRRRERQREQQCG
jgi:hypothetical protein